MINTESVLANFGLEKLFKVKNGYFVRTEMGLFGEKYPFLTNPSFLNEIKDKVLQIKQDAIRQKHEKT